MGERLVRLAVGQRFSLAAVMVCLLAALFGIVAGWLM
jgi:hypothetical protein